MRIGQEPADEAAAAAMEFLIREFDPERDRPRVEAMERNCDVGSRSSGNGSIFTDLLGDPICRIRHSPAFLMLVAETCGTAAEEAAAAAAAEEEEKQIVGLIRGCIKTVTCGVRRSNACSKSTSPLYTKLGYVLGLRVSPHHRRKGIGLALVKHVERWFRDMGAEYAYMATEKDNDASIGLFTGRCGYTKFRTPSLLVHPVFAHRLKTPARVTIVRLAAYDADSLYRRRFSATEFFPRDIDAVFSNPLSLGTFLAVGSPTFAWPGSAEAFLDDPPESWAVASVWNCKEVFRLEVRGVSRLRRGLAKATRLADRALPWARVPSVPDIFRPFTGYFVYGLGGEGAAAGRLVTALFRHAHNMARRAACAVVATEVGNREPLREGIPHWKWMSCEEDLWCVKRLADDYSDGDVGDWTKSEPGPSIFVDPREV